MIQKFIELGEGYSDIYELIEIGLRNKDRVMHLMAFHTEVKGKPATSLAIVLAPSGEGKFQPIYICREGIPYPHITKNKRYDMFVNLSEQLNKQIIELDVKPSTFFHEKELYYQHLIGILRMNRYIPPLT
jgi:hypothetical protein